MKFIAGDCLILSIPSNGGIVYSSSANQNGNYAPNTVATYSCTRGQLFNGDVMRTCQLDRTWTGTEPTCAGRYYSVFIITIILCWNSNL